MKLLTSVAVAVGLTAVLLSQAVSAASLVEHSAGVKLLAGADVWSAPSNTPNGSEGLGFVGTAGGFSYGGAVYYELKLIKFIGLEADLAYQHGSFHRKVTINKIYDVTETISTNGLRLPILVKLNIPLALGRLWVGAGPEFTLTQSSSASVEQTGGPTARVDGGESTRNVKPTFGTVGLGLVIEIPGIGVDIPLELRVSKNLSQPSDYSDRITDESVGTNTSLNVRAESSWVYRLGAGIGYRF
jgi:hypothetical protein